MSKEFEEKSPERNPEKFNNAANSAKVGFAAIQEMARLQEEALMKDDKILGDSKHLDQIPDNPKEKLEAQAKDIARDLGFLRFDPDANCLKLENFDYPSPNLESQPKVGKFPLEVTTPVQSPPITKRRFNSHRYF